MSWQNNLTHWLRQKAQQQLRAAMDNAAPERSTGPEGPGGPNSFDQQLPRPSHVGIVFANPREAAGLIDRLDGVIATQASGFRVHDGGLDGRHVVVLTPGEGPQAVAHAIEAVIEGHRPRWMIAAGFATGLAAHVARGDMLLADSIALVDGRQQPVDMSYHPLTTGPSRCWRVGRLLSIERAIASPRERHELGESSGALAADIQSWTVAEVCRQRNVPLLALHIIRQAADEEPSRDLALLEARHGLARRMGALTGALLRHPASLKEAWQEKERNLIGSDCLAECLIDVIGQLLPRGGMPAAAATADSMSAGPARVP